MNTRANSLLVRLLAVVFVCLQLQACGQKGDLYLPVDSSEAYAAENQTEAMRKAKRSRPDQAVSQPEDLTEINNDPQ